MNSLILRKTTRDDLIASLKVAIPYVHHVPLKQNLANMIGKLSNLTEIQGADEMEVSPVITKEDTNETTTVDAGSVTINNIKSSTVRKR
jgi:hypothetical protein